MRRRNIWIIGLVITNVVLFSLCSITDEVYEFDVVMIGDSITYGGDWNLLLKNEKIANLGIGGDITDGVLNRFGYVYLLEPNICFIMIGINDLVSNRPVEDIMINYRKIAVEIKNHEIKVIIQSVLHLGEKYYINHMAEHDKNDWIKINENVKTLNEKLEEMALEFNIEFINLNDELSINNVLLEKYADEDGIHLNILGYEKWAEIIKPIIYKSKGTTAS